MKTLNIKKIHEDAITPTREHLTDAGLDIYAAEEINVTGVMAEMIPTGIAIDIPPGYEGTIRPRSGKTSKTNLRVQLGTVDCGYNGEIKVIADTLNGSSYLVQKGEKIAQLVISPIVTPEINLVDEFETSSDRGDKGFGSSDTYILGGVEVTEEDYYEMVAENTNHLGN